MRAGRYDIVVETGALWTRAFQALAPGVAVQAQSASIGTRYFVDGYPLKLYAKEPASAGRVRLDFGTGLYSDPVILPTATALISPAVLVPLMTVGAAYTIHTTDVDGLPVVKKVDIPATIAADGLTFTLLLDPVTTAAMEAGAHSWDCYARSATWDWQRILEGTFTIIKGDAR